MKIVECPECQRRYDPQIDEMIDEGGDEAEISLKVVCPHCGQWVRLPEWKCVDPPGVPDEILEEMKQQSIPIPENDDRKPTFGPGILNPEPTGVTPEGDSGDSVSVD